MSSIEDLGRVPAPCILYKIPFSRFTVSDSRGLPIKSGYNTKQALAVLPSFMPKPSQAKIRFMVRHPVTLSPPLPFTLPSLPRSPPQTFTNPPPLPSLPTDNLPRLQRRLPPLLSHKPTHPPLILHHQLIPHPHPPDHNPAFPTPHPHHPSPNRRTSPLRANSRRLRPALPHAGSHEEVRGCGEGGGEDASRGCGVGCLEDFYEEGGVERGRRRRGK